MASRVLCIIPCVCVVATIFLAGTHSAQFGVLNPKDLLSSGKSITTGVAKTIPSIIPGPEQLLTMSKQTLVGLPFETAAYAINQLCSLALKANATVSKYEPDYKKMNFVLMTHTGNVSIPFTDANALWQHKAFNKQLPTTVFITGWTTDIQDANDALDVMAKAYRCRGNYNFIVIDTARFVDTLYTWSSFNTEKLGSFVGEAIQQLVAQVPASKIHLIGHSLGAHMVGAAGRSFQRIANQSLPRITGLDPANPCFNEGETLSGLQRGDADFVDIIHTNNGVLGKRDPIGDIDFYPNGVVPLAKGCFSITCSHARAWEYYAETVYPGNENNFEAIKCNSLASLLQGACHGKRIAMGFAVPVTVKGNHFLETNSEKPFGLNGVEKNEKSKQQSCAHREGVAIQ